MSSAVYGGLYILGLLMSVGGFVKGYGGTAWLGLIMMSTAGFLLAVNAKRGDE